MWYPWNATVDNNRAAAALALVLCAVLLYKVFVVDGKWRLQQADGFAPGSSLAHQGQRDDAGYSSNTVIESDLVDKESMYPHEPPVFWNAGSFNAVNTLQHKGIADEGADMNTVEGLSRARRGSYVEGMAASAGVVKGEELIPY